MVQSFKQAGDAANYTIGGIRAWFNRLVDDSVTPNRYEGFIDLGNVVEAPQESEVEDVEHFTAKTGTRKRDRKVSRDITEDIVLTLDEPSVENARHFFRGDVVVDRPAIAATPPSDWAATTAYVVGDFVKPTTPNGFYAQATVAGTSDAGEPTWPTTDLVTIVDATVTWRMYEATQVSDEVILLEKGTTKILFKGFLAESIVVKDITDTTTYVKDTDYTEEAILGGWIGIKRIAAGTIAEGDFLRVSYNHAARKLQRFSPQTNSEVIGQFVLFAVSDTGNEFMRFINKAQIEPEGAFDFDDEDFSTFQLNVAILDDSDTNPNTPFGLFDHVGVGSDI